MACSCQSRGLHGFGAARGLRGATSIDCQIKQLAAQNSGTRSSSTGMRGPLKTVTVNGTEHALPYKLQSYEQVQSALPSKYRYESEKDYFDTSWGVIQLPIGSASQWFELFTASLNLLVANTDEIVKAYDNRATLGYGPGMWEASVEANFLDIKELAVNASALAEYRLSLLHAAPKSAARDNEANAIDTWRKAMETHVETVKSFATWLNDRNVSLFDRLISKLALLLEKLAEAIGKLGSAIVSGILRGLGIPLLVVGGIVVAIWAYSKLRHR